MSLIASTKKANSGTSPSIDTTGASIITAVISGAGTISISDNKGNSYTERTPKTGGFSSNTAIFDCFNPAVGTGHTFTIGGTNPGAVIAAFVGPTAVTTAFDVESGTIEGGSPVSPGSITPNHPDELVVLGVGGQASSFTPGAGYTLVDFLAIAGGTNFAAGMAYQQQTTATATNPSSTTTAVATCVIAAYRVNDVPGGPLTAGALSKDSQGPYRLGLSWTHSSGGTSPVGEQLQRSVAGAGVWSNVFGLTLSPVLDETPVPGVGYDYRVAYTDASPATVYSNTVTFGATRTLVEYEDTTQIGTSGSLNPGNTKDKVFDDDYYTAYQAANATGDWVGIDLGSGKSAAARWFEFAAMVGDATFDNEQRLLGGKFQASNDATFATGVADLYTVPAFPAPIPREASRVPVNPAGTAYRAYRYLSATGGYVSLARFRVIGDPGAGVDAKPVAPIISPFGGRFPAGTRVVTITSGTDTAAVYYTTDGTTPDNTKTRYAGPFALTIGGSGTTVKAVAYETVRSTPYSDVVSADFKPWGFKPNEVWYDKDGHRMQAQSGDILYSGERWWWFGMGNNRYMGALDITDHYTTNLYSSSDLYNWRKEGADRTASILGNPTGHHVYRVHVYYSTTDGRWVLWANNFIGSGQYRVMAASSGADIRGPWAWLGTPAFPGDRPNTGPEFKDHGRLIDDDGTNYIFITNGGTGAPPAGFDVQALDAARTSLTGSTIRIDGAREGPAPVPKRGSTNFFLSGDGNYYDDSLTYHPVYQTASSVLGTWSSTADLFSSDPVGTAYNSQQNQVVKLPGKSDGYLYIADKWFQKSQSPLGQGIWESTQVWLPLTFPTSTSVQAQRPTSWDFSTFTDSYTPPALTLVSTGATSATLSYTAASGGTAPYTYKLQRAANVYADWEDVSGGTSSPVTDTALVQGRAYEYRVRCVDNAGVVVFSNQITAVTLAVGGVFPFHLDNELSGATYALGM